MDWRARGVLRISQAAEVLDCHENSVRNHAPILDTAVGKRVPVRWLLMQIGEYHEPERAEEIDPRITEILADRA